MLLFFMLLIYLLRSLLLDYHFLYIRFVFDFGLLNLLLHFFLVKLFYLLLFIKMQFLNLSNLKFLFTKVTFRCTILIAQCILFFSLIFPFIFLAHSIFRFIKIYSFLLSSILDLIINFYLFLSIITA